MEIVYGNEMEDLESEFYLVMGSFLSHEEVNKFVFHYWSYDYLDLLMHKDFEISEDKIDDYVNVVTALKFLINYISDDKKQELAHIIKEFMYRKDHSLDYDQLLKQQGATTQRSIKELHWKPIHLVSENRNPSGFLKERVLYRVNAGDIFQGERIYGIAESGRWMRVDIWDEDGKLVEQRLYDPDKELRNHKLWYDGSVSDIKYIFINKEKSMKQIWENRLLKERIIYNRKHPMSHDFLNEK